MLAYDNVDDEKSHEVPDTLRAILLLTVVLDRSQQKSKNIFKEENERIHRHKLTKMVKQTGVRGLLASFFLVIPQTTLLI